MSIKVLHLPKTNFLATPLAMYALSVCATEYGCRGTILGSAADWHELMIPPPQ